MEFDQDCRDMLNEDIIKKYECIDEYTFDKRELIINEIRKRGLLTEEVIQEKLHALKKIEATNENLENENFYIFKSLLNTLKNMFPYEESQKKSSSNVIWGRRKGRISVFFSAYYIYIIFQLISGFPIIFWKDIDAKKAYIAESSYHHLKYQYTVNGKTYINDKTHYGFIFNDSLVTDAIFSLNNGETIKIKYNPYDPKDSSIIGFVGLRLRDYLLIICIALWYSFSFWRKNLTKQQIITELFIDILFGFPLFVVYAAMSSAS